MPDGSATSKFYRPKLLTVLIEGYSAAMLRRDTVAALTVAIVALPLSMAIAVASGVSPDRGLYSAIVGGFLVSALGGSRFQVGGPAGAFIVLVQATVIQFGTDGLLLAVLLSGAMLVLIGISRLGSLIRYIPHAVTVGFTGGIAVTILASQLKDLGGLRLSSVEPGALPSKLAALWAALPSISYSALCIGIGSAVLILFLRRWQNVPSMLIAIAAASFVAHLLHLPIETIGSHFGDLPRSLPAPQWPPTSWERVIEIMPSALSFTLLGGVESLLSAKVADGMTRRVHRSNMELVAQGIANIATSFFGGICVTGTIARTATNIRAGAKTPIAGMLHSVFLLIFMLIAAPLASFIPLAALAGILIVVAWNMVEKEEFLNLLRHWHTGVVLMVTFAGTIIQSLTVGIIAGCLLAALFSISRQAIPKDGDFN